MVLERQKKKEMEEDFEEDEELDEPQQRKFPKIPLPPKPSKVREEHDAGDGEAIIQPVGYRIYDDEGDHYDFPIEQEAIAKCFARIFKALKSQ